MTGFSAHALGLYEHVYDQYFQISSMKPLGQPKPNFMSSLLGKGDKKYKNGLGNMTKMAAIPIYGKNGSVCKPE